MILSPLETSILLVIIIGAACWWRLHGQREQALRYAKAHCEKLNLSLLDDYVALKSIHFKRDATNRLRLTHSYNFEFTATGEQRYTATLHLFGYYLDSIELPPYAYDDMSHEENATIIEQPSSTTNYLEKYPRYKNK